MQHATNPHLCWLVEETLNFILNDPSNCCYVLLTLNAPQRMSWCVLQVAKTEPVTTVDCAFCAHNHPAMYPFVAGTRLSIREGVYAKETFLIGLLFLTDMWTIFGLGSFAAYKNGCSDLGCKFQLPKKSISKIMQK